MQIAFRGRPPATPAEIGRVFRARKAPGGRVTARAARRFLGGGLLVALLTTVAVSVGVIEGIDTIADAFSSGQLITSADLTPAKVGAAQTIMIVGSDKRPLAKDAADRQNPPHTDTILLVRLDPKAGDVSVLSVPRDLLVPKFTFRGTPYVDTKINFAYTIGSQYGHSPTAADRLALDVVKKALGNIVINDFIDLNFASFETVVAKLGCVYVDVDHFYFHHNVAGEPADQNYEAINIRPGYKSLCGNTALAYVRYRHDDNTFARDARQQDFLRQSKNQLGVTGLLGHSGEILGALGKSITTNIHNATAVARLVNLALFTLDGPVRQVRFPDNPIQIGGGDYQTATKAEIRRVVARFENSSPATVTLPGSSRPPPSGGVGGSPSAGHHRVHHSHRAPAAIPGLVATPPSMRTQALELAPQLPFKVELPMLSSEWAAQTGQQYDYYAYQLRDLAGHQHWSYHITWADTQAAGAYYGIEGTTWTNPPLFEHADTRYYGGRAYAEVGNGHHIQHIGWIDRGVLYWINNTLFDDLTNAQMVAMARSSRPIF
jgi:polyisoprenyl-teichoic acid--peptidoglycan teichoic acid transferase